MAARLRLQSSVESLDGSQKSRKLVESVRTEAVGISEDMAD